MNWKQIAVLCAVVVVTWDVRYWGPPCAIGINTDPYTGEVTQWKECIHVRPMSKEFPHLKEAQEFVQNAPGCHIVLHDCAGVDYTYRDSWPTHFKIILFGKVVYADPSVEDGK